MENINLEQILELQGRDLATLSEEENNLLKLFLLQGRKLGANIALFSNVSLEDLAKCSNEQAEQVLKQANTKIQVSNTPFSDLSWFGNFAVKSVA